MPTVFVLGAGASIGAAPAGRTRFPATNEILKCVRTIFCESGKGPCPALSLFLGRFAPVKGSLHTGTLHPGFDDINVEELYAAIEFETRITDHLMLSSGDAGSGSQFFQEYFSDQYRHQVDELLAHPHYQVLEQFYSAPNGSRAFPYRHQHFLGIVRFELLDAMSYIFGVLSKTEDTSNFTRLVKKFQEGDTVISFNYDLLVEHHLCSDRPGEWSFGKGYGLRPTSDGCRLDFHGSDPDHNPVVKVLKPHGSCNWHFRIAQGTSLGYPGLGGYRMVPQAVGAGYGVRDLRTLSLLVTDHYEGMQPTEGPPGFFTWFMIPPTPYKAEHSFAGEFLHLPGGGPVAVTSSSLWLPQLLFRLGLVALRTADRIVFVGFSMAPADTSVRMMFRAAADGNDNLQLVEIADPDRDGDVERRIRRALPKACNFRTYSSFSRLLDEWDSGPATI